MMACIRGRSRTPHAVPRRNRVRHETATSECDNSLASGGRHLRTRFGRLRGAVRDLKAALSRARITSSSWRRRAKGQGGCALKKDGLYCDNDVSDPGDACHTLGDFACTPDKKLALKCGADFMHGAPQLVQGGEGVPSPPRCRKQKRVEFVCDDAVADANDPCDENGEEACTMDRKGLRSAPATSSAADGPRGGVLVRFRTATSSNAISTGRRSRGGPASDAKKAKKGK